MTAILIVSQPMPRFKVCPVTVLLREHYRLVTEGKLQRKTPQSGDCGALGCPRLDLNQHARKGTGPQPAAYAYSATGA